MTTLSVEAAALVRQASGRYADAMVCDAVGHYVTHVGAVPDAAWGTMDWTAIWKKNWHEAVADRAREARSAGERFDDIAETLYQVAADYTGTDVKVAADFTAIGDSPLRPFVDALERVADATAHPGGRLSMSSGFGGGPYAPAIPDDTGEGHRLNLLFQDGKINQQEMWPAGTDLSRTPSHRMRAELTTEGRRKLAEFIHRWADDLGRAESIVGQWGLLPAESGLDRITAALSAWPGVIANRANLLKLGANTYRDLRANMAAQVKDLQQYWKSPAAGAYAIYAGSLGDYYEAIAGNLQWLGEEGEKAAQTIDGLQLAFANLGYQHMLIISAQLKAYLDAANSLSHAVEDPLKGLANAVTGLLSSLNTSWAAAVQKAQADLDVSRKVIEGAPRFTDETRDARQPPASPSTEWRGHAWKP
ncbi:hypothetical protein GCM10010172_50840 [Paractinoplanes ferrugineus]|uniref:Uncharacterized protein n=1 Tax=Paractinoplanes ferrugineus TaxID=113564 RepID=A0A919MHR3_9ACTN|nr:hypothetical protein [Actinoplanes ferrugineus]GIE16098.1 hypothetical protein Afe05nite_79380 [Actinoplanes ferrugineus]